MEFNKCMWFEVWGYFRALDSHWSFTKQRVYLMLYKSKRFCYTGLYHCNVVAVLDTEKRVILNIRQFSKCTGANFAINVTDLSCQNTLQGEVSKPWVVIKSIDLTLLFSPPAPLDRYWPLCKSNPVLTIELQKMNFHSSPVRSKSRNFASFFISKLSHFPSASTWLGIRLMCFTLAVHCYADWIVQCVLSGPLLGLTLP